MLTNLLIKTDELYLLQLLRRLGGELKTHVGSKEFDLDTPGEALKHDCTGSNHLAHDIYCIVLTAYTIKDKDHNGDFLLLGSC